MLICCDDRFECQTLETVNVTPFMVTRVMVSQLMWRNSPFCMSKTVTRFLEAGSYFIPSPVTPFFTPPLQFMSRSSPLVRFTKVTPKTRPDSLASSILSIASDRVICMLVSLNSWNGQESRRNAPSRYDPAMACHRRRR